MKLVELLDQDVISHDIQIGVYDKVDGLIIFEDVKSIAKICKGEVLGAEVTLINVERATLTITIDYEF